MYKTPNKYYEDNHKENSKLSFKAFQKRSEFWQGVLVASASLYGKQVSRPDIWQDTLFTRVLLLCRPVLLTIFVTTASLTLSLYTILLERHRQEVEKELLSALNKDALVSEVHTGLSKKEEFVEWLALFALLSTPFLLLAYTILKMYVN